jgi:hypothetical protein
MSFVWVAKEVGVFIGIMHDAFRGLQMLFYESRGWFADFEANWFDFVAKAAGGAKNLWDMLTPSKSGPGVDTAFVAGVDNMLASITGFGEANRDIWRSIGDDAHSTTSGIIADGYTSVKVYEEFQRLIAEMDAKKGQTSGKKTEDITGLVIPTKLEKPDTSEFDSAFKRITDEYNQRFLTQEQQTLVWYEKEKALLAGHTESLAMLEQVKNDRMDEIRNEGVDNIRSEWESATMTEMELLDKKYLDQQAKYAENEEALLMLQQTYAAQRLELEKKQMEEYEVMNATFFDSLRSQWEDWHLSQYDINQRMGEMLYTSMDEFTQGIGDAVARTIVFGGDLGKSLSNLMKSIAANLLSSIIELGVKLLIQELFMKVVLGKTRQAMAIETIGASAAQEYAQVFATYASIPYVGPALGAAAGAAAAAALIGGATAMLVTSAVAGAAHGGLDNVPAEQTYLLDKGERVLSPNQNRDLTTFLGESNPTSSGGITIKNLHIRILDNATDLDSLRSMDKRDWSDLVYDKIIPAITDLRDMGVAV